MISNTSDTVEQIKFLMRVSAADISESFHKTRNRQASNTRNRRRRVRRTCAAGGLIKLHQVIRDARHIVHIGDLGGQGFSTVGARPHPHRLTLTFTLTATREGCLELLTEFPWRKTGTEKSSQPCWNLIYLQFVLLKTCFYCKSDFLHVQHSAVLCMLVQWHARLWICTLSRETLEGSQSTADYKLTTEEVVDDGISRTVGIYEPVGEREPCVHSLSVISILETPKDSIF